MHETLGRAIVRGVRGVGAYASGNPDGFQGCAGRGRWQQLRMWTSAHIWRGLLAALIAVVRGSTLAAIIATCLQAQPTNLQQEKDAFPAEFAFSYDAPNGSACTIEVSESNTYSPVVNDFNGTLYTGSNSDLSRSDTYVNGLHRIVIAGKGDSFYHNTDSTAAPFSRALHAATTHYIRVTCGSAATLTIDTSNIPLGQVVGTQGIRSAGPFQYTAPAINPLFQTAYIDAATGIKLASYPVYGYTYAGTTGATGVLFTSAENLSCSGWAASDAGTLIHALSANDNVYAQTSTSGCKMFVGLGDTGYNKYPNNNTYSGNELSFENISIRLDCNGAGCGGGKIFKIAKTTDRSTLVQTKSTTATTSEQRIVACHTFPCTIEANPGDVWSPVPVPRDAYALGIGYIYNSSMDYYTLNNLVTADCSARRPGDLLVWWDQGQVASFTGYVTATNCGAPSMRINSFAVADSSLVSIVVASNVATATVANPQAFLNYLNGAANLINVSGSATTALNGDYALAGGTPGGTTFTFATLGVANGTYSDMNLVIKWTNTTPRADGNGSGGIPFTYASGIANNSEYGFFVWTDDSLVSATIRIDEMHWRAASYIGTSGYGTLGAGSGGFNKRCQKVKTSGGYTLCAAGPLLMATKGESDGSLTTKFIGTAYLSPTAVGIIGALNQTLYFDHSDTDFHWDDTLPGVFYEVFPMTATSPATGTMAYGVAKFTLAHPEIQCGQIGTACTAADPDGSEGNGRWPTPDIDNANSLALTVCTAPCTMISHDKTIGGQSLVINPELGSSQELSFARFPTSGMEIQAVQDGYIKFRVREGQQDTFSQNYFFDIGNGLPIGGGYVPVHGGTYAAQQIYAFNPTYATRGCRWASDHTDLPVMYSHAFTIQECTDHPPYRFTITNNIPACSKAGSGNCDPCPAIMLDGVDYTGLSICLHATLTSSWDALWEGQPDAFGNFTPGDPVNVDESGNPAWHWLQHTAVRDIVRIFGSGNFEAMKLIQRNSATDVYYERGCNSNVSIDGSPKSWGTNSVWGAIGNSYNPICSQANTEVGGLGQQWDFVGDPLAADTSWTPWMNHGLDTCNGSTGVRLRPDYLVQRYDCSSWSSIKAVTPPQSTITLPSVFASVYTIGGGNCIEKHPSYVNGVSATAGNRTWFPDSNPIECLYEGTTVQHSHISGSLYKLGSGRFTFNPKQYPIGAFSGTPPYLNISGPGAVLGDTAADRGKDCIAAVANECVSGSLPGDIYVNGPLDPLQLNCRGIEFYFGEIDTCAGNIPNFGASVNQWTVPTDNVSTLSTNMFRSISKNATYRFGATDNLKANPDGDFLFYRSSYLTAKLPSYPSDDLKVRNTWRAQTITVASVSASTARVVIKFGYDENFYPNGNRNEAGYAAYASVTPNTVTNATCTSGTATVTIGSHPFVVGNNVSIDSINYPDPSRYNGTFVLTGISGTTISYALDCTALHYDSGGVVGNPFLWGSELVAASGVSCAASCTVQIPWIEGRVPRYQVICRDAGGSTLATGPMVIGDLNNGATGSCTASVAYSGFVLTGPRRITGGASKRQ